MVMALLSGFESYSQTAAGKAKTNHLPGTYKGMDNCSISEWTVTIRPNHKLLRIYTGHYFTNKVDKGKWEQRGDTILMTLKGEEPVRFLLKDKELCRKMQESGLCKDFCLKKE